MPDRPVDALEEAIEAVIDAAEDADDEASDEVASSDASGQVEESPNATEAGALAADEVGSDLEDESDASDEVDADAAGDEDEADAPLPEHLPSLIESLLFVSDGPVEERILARVLGVRTRVVVNALEVLRERLEGTGVRLQLGPDGAQLVTAPESATYVEGFLGLEQGRRLSNAALEVLAIVAYRQPVTRATVEAIRGVSSDGAIQTLRARGLIEDGGRAQGPGRPTLFVTSQRFLEHFGLESSGELPELGDYELPPPDAPQPMRLDTSGGAPSSEPRPEDVVAERLVRLARAAVRSMRPTTEWQRRRTGGPVTVPSTGTTELPAARVSPPSSGKSSPPGVQRPLI
ncbi:MAG: SMC-Scp complex subunit ScpB [Dehalococcoidia bacterium]